MSKCSVAAVMWSVHMWYAVVGW